MAEDKPGFMSRLFGRKKAADPIDEPKIDNARDPDRSPNPAIPEGGAKDLGRGGDREVASATAEEDSEAGDDRFLHEVSKDDGGLEEDEEPRSPPPAPVPPAAPTP
ncbi:MAG: hypothetical protein V2I43_28640, partial [Parvularcula sp.]|nr:hypothetical protein [Parvularcula sp.]